jgi:hypothetical protein
MATKHARADIVGEAFAELKQNFFDAALGGQPAVEIPTPYWAAGSTGAACYQPFCDVVADGISAEGDTDLAELLIICGMAAKGQDATGRAMAWIQSRATRYAELNCDDMAQMILEAEEA